MASTRAILATTVAESIGAAIVSGRHRVGAALPSESELCRQHDASRTVVREAIKMLLANGLLLIRPRLGSVVRAERDWNILNPDVLRWMLAREFSLPLLLEFTDLRLAAEPGAAALAARHATAPDRAALHAAVDTMCAPGTDEAGFLLADIAFHMAVLDATQNRFYIGLRPTIETALRFSFRQTTERAEMLATAREHAVLAETILAGDAAAAHAGMQVLVAQAHAKITALMSAASACSPTLHH